MRKGPPAHPFSSVSYGKWWACFLWTRRLIDIVYNAWFGNSYFILSPKVSGTKNGDTALPFLRLFWEPYPYSGNIGEETYPPFFRYLRCLIIVSKIAHVDEQKSLPLFLWMKLLDSNLQSEFMTSNLLGDTWALHPTWATKKTWPYLPLYWLVNRDLSKGLL